MTVRETAAFLRQHDNYLILTHKRPDGDTIGCAAALCRALRGKGGGYRLTRPPEECSVGEILQLTEGSMAPVYCLEPGGACEKAGQCITYPMWRQLDGLIDGYLRRVSLADLLQGRLPQDMPCPPPKENPGGTICNCK